MSRVVITQGMIDAAAIAAELNDPRAGAIAVFAGVVREESHGNRSLKALDYEAYEEMALERLHATRERALRDFSILDAAVFHRIGRLAIGETSIAVAVSAAHRGAAFDACRWIVDTVKADAPIWKKDVWSDGSTTWVDPIP